MESATPTAEGSDDLKGRHAAAFEAAWHDLGSNCADTVAPEATYQAWLAHFLIQRLGVLHVVREVDFGAKYLGEQAAVLFGGSSLMVDILVLRQPVVQLPRRAALADETLPGGEPNPRSGLKRLGDFSVITELKVHSTQAEGLDQAQVIRDFLKLSALLNAAARNYPENPLPVAYVGVLANHPTRRFNFDLLQQKLADRDVHPDVKLLTFTRH